MSKSTKSDKADTSIDVKPELPSVKAEEKVEETPVVKEIIPEKKIEVKPVEPKTIEEKIVDYISSRKGVQRLRLNDFLKSLYPVVFTDPQLGWKSQNGSKTIKGLLSKMQDEGILKISNDRHKMLGKFYYKDGQPETQHHDLDSIELLIEQ